MDFTTHNLREKEVSQNTSYISLLDNTPIGYSLGLMSRHLTSTVLMLTFVAMAISLLPAAYATPSSFPNQMQHHAMDSSAAEMQHEMVGMTDCETHCADMISKASCASCCIQMCASMSAVLAENSRFITLSLPDYVLASTTTHLAQHTSFDPPPPRL